MTCVQCLAQTEMLQCGRIPRMRKQALGFFERMMEEVTTVGWLAVVTTGRWASSSIFPTECSICRLVAKGATTSKIKHAIKLKTSPARLAQLLQPSLAFCFSSQPMAAYRPFFHYSVTSVFSCVFIVCVFCSFYTVQQLCKSCRTCCMFYCMFYFTCDRSLSVRRRLAWHPSSLVLRSRPDRSPGVVFPRSLSRQPIPTAPRQPPVLFARCVPMVRPVCWPGGAALLIYLVDRRPGRRGRDRPTDRRTDGWRQDPGRRAFSGYSWRPRRRPCRWRYPVGGVREQVS